MKMKATQWGNSLAIRIPKPFAEQAGINNGTMVEITLQNRQIIVTRTEENLEDLLERITETNIHDETDTGTIKGKEEW